MDWLQAPDYWFSRLIVERGVGIVYLVAFLAAFNQFPALLGDRGLEPAAAYLARVSFRREPSIFHWRYSDRLLRICAALGITLSAAIVVGLVERLPLWTGMAVWLVLWILYLSIVNIGQTFYSFGWESLLLEAGFFAIFLGPAGMAPPTVVMWMLRWLVFRVEFGAGLIKLRGDPCWRDLTCLYYHHETQPMPNPLSWYFHRLPRLAHRAEVLGNHIAQLAAPVGLFFPQPVADIAAAVMIITQLWLVLSGNFSWLNLITIIIAVSALDNNWLHRIIPVHQPALSSPPLWFAVVLILLTVLVIWLSYRPAKNLVSRRQLMNFSFNPFHLVNAYGAFGSITRVRDEIVLEGTSDERISDTTEWQAYEFKGKPGDVRRLPPQLAPYHLRLDWLMWFAAMGDPFGHPWFLPLLVKLLEGDRATLKLLRQAPFRDRPPVYIRARFYRYRFTTRQERRTTGAWWHRDLQGDYVPPIRLRQARRESADLTWPGDGRLE